MVEHFPDEPLAPRHERELEILHELYSGTEGLGFEEAWPQMLDRLGVNPARPRPGYEVQEAVRLRFGQASIDVYDDLADRPEAELLAQAIDLINIYPWLAHGLGDGSLEPDNLARLAESRVFNDYALLFGLSEWEGHRLVRSLWQPPHSNWPTDKTNNPERVHVLETQMAAASISEAQKARPGARIDTQHAGEYL